MAVAQHSGSDRFIGERAPAGTTAAIILAGIATQIRRGEQELERARCERSESQAERWQGYLDVLVGADVVLAEQPGYAVADRCARYAHRQESALRLSQARTWLGLMERTGKQEAIRRLWHLCAQ